jgi:hypothetical protein
MAGLIDSDRRRRWFGSRRGLLAVLGALVAAVCVPSVAWGQSVTFSGPTHFSAGADLGTDVYEIGVADFNADGDLDLAIPTFGPHISILLGGPGGSFGAPTLVAMPPGFMTTSLAVGDFNADGDPDLAVVTLSGTSDVPQNVAVLLGEAGASFSAPMPLAAGEFPIDVAVGDFNADGDPDLAVANLIAFDTDAISLYVGGPGGSFTNVTGIDPFAGEFSPEAPSSLSVGDFNRDGDADLAAVHNQSVSVIPGGPGASFGAPTTTRVLSEDELNLTPASALGDFNRDGDPDLVVLSLGGEIAVAKVLVLTGSSGVTFAAPIRLDVGGRRPESVAVADFNQDGDPDLAVTAFLEDRVGVFLGAAGASFTGPTSFAVGDGPRPIAVGDFDTDRDADVVAGNILSDSVSILLNTSRRPLPTDKDQCKNGGWRQYGVFKNQGDCVSFVVTGGRNQPANPPT